MEKNETTRLIEEAYCLIKQSDLSPEEKDNLKRNIEYFMSCISKDSYVAGCQWAWFDYGEGRRGLDLKWDWKDVKGVFGFYTDNGHGFSFEYGNEGDACMFGGEDGDYGFSCGIFLCDFESMLADRGY